MRWPLPDGRFITPDIFITAAENEGMIVPLSRHLLSSSPGCRRWQVAGDFISVLKIFRPEHLVT